MNESGFLLKALLAFILPCHPKHRKNDRHFNLGLILIFEYLDREYFC